MLERFTPAVKPHGIFHSGSSSESRPEAQRFRSRFSRSVEERRKVLLVLPGRWRRPFHEDPRYQVVVKSFDDNASVSICFYSPTWGPVPIELDETFPIAQTEARDLGEPDLYSSKALDVAKYAKEFLPTRVILVSDGDFGSHVVKELQRSLGKRRVSVLDGEKMKPQAIIEAIRHKAARYR